MDQEMLEENVILSLNFYQTINFFEKIEGYWQ